MPLWLVVVAIALAPTDAQESSSRGPDKVCSDNTSGENIKLPCSLPSGNLTLHYSEAHTILTVRCRKESTLVCGELALVLPFLNKYNTTERSHRIDILKIASCGLSRESLECTVGVAGAYGPQELILNLIPDELEAVHFEGMEGVTTVKIYKYTGSTYLPLRALSSLPNLKTFNTIHSNIVLTSEADFRLPKLTSLNLMYNTIKSVPKAAFKAVPEVQELVLGWDGIEEIDVDAFEGLTKLAKLTLSGNPLSHLPGGVFRHTPKVAHLALSGNSLLRLSDDVFAGLYRLRELIIFGIKRDVLKLSNKTFSNLPSLFKLHLDYNRIEDIPAELFRNSTNLRELYLPGNNIKYLPNTILKGLRLTLLDLRHNNISFLPSDVFSEQISLTELILSFNELTSLPGGLFSNMYSLKKLDLKGNSIKFLDKSTFVGLYNLRKLSLERNEIEHVDPRIFESSSYVEINDFSFPSDAIIDLQHNKIQQLVPPPYKTHTVGATFRMGSNPYKCDCFLYDFMFNYRQRHNMLNIDFKGAKCAQPNELYGTKLVNWQPEELTCDVDCSTEESIIPPKSQTVIVY